MGNINSNGYCLFPFNYPFIDTDGIFGLCCRNVSKQSKLPFNISEHKLIDVWNSKEMLKIRQDFIEKKEVVGCWKCYKPEAASVESFRQRRLRTFNNGISFDDTIIRGLDIRPGNICNLQCIMCSPHYSNRFGQLQQKQKEFFGSDIRTYKNLASNYKWAENPIAWDNIMTGVTKHLQELYVAGGEPFYLPLFSETIKRITSVTENVYIVINSNGTRYLSESDVNLYKNKNINIRLSIDGFKESEEFVRQGTVWEEKLTVMDQYYKLFNIQTWDISANAFNVRQLPKLIKFLFDRYPDVPVEVRPVVSPSHLAVNNISEELRKDVLEFLTNNKDKIRSPDLLIQNLKLPYTGNVGMLKKQEEFWNIHGDYNKGVVSFDPVLAEWIHKT